MSRDARRKASLSLGNGWPVEMFLDGFRNGFGSLLASYCGRGCWAGGNGGEGIWAEKTTLTLAIPTRQVSYGIA